MSNNKNFTFSPFIGESGTHYCFANLYGQTIFTPKENPLPGIEGLGDTQPAMFLGSGKTAKAAQMNAEKGLREKLRGVKTRSIHTLAQEGITQW